MAQKNKYRYFYKTNRFIKGLSSYTNVQPDDLDEEYKILSDEEAARQIRARYSSIDKNGDVYLIKNELTDSIADIDTEGEYLELVLYYTRSQYPNLFEEGKNGDLQLRDLNSSKYLKSEAVMQDVLDRWAEFNKIEDEYIKARIASIFQEEIEALENYCLNAPTSIGIKQILLATRKNYPKIYEPASRGNLQLKELSETDFGDSKLCRAASNRRKEITSKVEKIRDYKVKLETQEFFRSEIDALTEFLQAKETNNFMNQSHAKVSANDEMTK